MINQAVLYVGRDYLRVVLGWPDCLLKQTQKMTAELQVRHLKPNCYFSETTHCPLLLFPFHLVTKRKGNAHTQGVQPLTALIMLYLLQEHHSELHLPLLHNLTAGVHQCPGVRSGEASFRKGMDTSVMIKRSVNRDLT